MAISVVSKRLPVSLKSMGKQLSHLTSVNTFMVSLWIQSFWVILNKKMKSILQILVMLRRAASQWDPLHIWLFKSSWWQQKCSSWGFKAGLKKPQLNTTTGKSTVSCLIPSSLPQPNLMLAFKIWLNWKRVKINITTTKKKITFWLSCFAQIHKQRTRTTQKHFLQ